MPDWTGFNVAHALHAPMRSPCTTRMAHAIPAESVLYVHLAYRGLECQVLPSKKDVAGKKAAVEVEAEKPLSKAQQRKRQQIERKKATQARLAGMHTFRADEANLMLSPSPSPNQTLC